MLRWFFAPSLAYLNLFFSSAPKSPKSIKVTNISSSSVQLIWEPSVDDTPVTAYFIEKRDTAKDIWIKVKNGVWFLVTNTRLLRSLCRSVRWSICQSVGPLVRRTLTQCKNTMQGMLYCHCPPMRDWCCHVYCLVYFYNAFLFFIDKQKKYNYPLSRWPECLLKLSSMMLITWYLGMSTISEFLLKMIMEKAIPALQMLPWEPSVQMVCKS